MPTPPTSKEILTTPTAISVNISAILLTNMEQGQLKGKREMVMKEWAAILDNPPKRIGCYRLIGVLENMGDKVILYYLSGERER